jgi:hypothetical protein
VYDLLSFVTASEDSLDYGIVSDWDHEQVDGAGQLVELDVVAGWCLGVIAVVGCGDLAKRVGLAVVCCSFEDHDWNVLVVAVVVEARESTDQIEALAMTRSNEIWGNARHGLDFVHTTIPCITLYPTSLVLLTHSSLFAFRSMILFPLIITTLSRCFSDHVTDIEVGIQDICEEPASSIL